MTTDEKYMKAAIRLAKKAGGYQEVPIGCVIVRDGKIIARGYNRRNMDKSTLSHAEMIAIRKASKKTGDWRLEDCIIYVTMEPCMMCSGAIEQSRMKKIVYGVKNENYGSTDQLKNIEIISQVCEKECRELVQSFFKKRR